MEGAIFIAPLADKQHYGVVRFVPDPVGEAHTFRQFAFTYDSPAEAAPFAQAMAAMYGLRVITKE
jgi:hypothetical protein